MAEADIAAVAEAVSADLRAAAIVDLPAAAIADLRAAAIADLPAAVIADLPAAAIADLPAAAIADLPAAAIADLRERPPGGAPVRRVSVARAVTGAKANAATVAGRAADIEASAPGDFADKATAASGVAMARTGNATAAGIKDAAGNVTSAGVIFAGADFTADSGDMVPYTDGGLTSHSTTITGGDMTVTA